MLHCKKPATVIPVGMSVNLDPNNTWSATYYDAYIDTVSTTKILVIDCIDSNLSVSHCVDDFTLQISNFNYKSGVYYVNDTSASIFHYALCTWIVASSGTITITQVSQHNVQGTFNCTLLGVTTTGQFNVPIH